jgi:hypothetical protein
LDKYDSEGKEIVYTIEEAYEIGYKPSYDGFNISNTFDPTDPNIPDEWLKKPPPPTPSPSPSPAPFTPQTGDRNNLVLWLVLMAASALTWIAVFAWGMHEKRYRPRYAPSKH